MSKDNSHSKSQAPIKAKDLESKKEPKGGLPAVQKVRESARRGG